MQMSPIIAVHMTASLIALVIGPIAMWARLGQTKRPWITERLAMAGSL